MINAFWRGKNMKVIKWPLLFLIISLYCNADILTDQIVIDGHAYDDFKLDDEYHEILTHDEKYNLILTYDKERQISKLTFAGNDPPLLNHNTVILITYKKNKPDKIVFRKNDKVFKEIYINYFKNEKCKFKVIENNEVQVLNISKKGLIVEIEYTPGIAASVVVGAFWYSVADNKFILDFDVLEKDSYTHEYSKELIRIEKLPETSGFDIYYGKYFNDTPSVSVHKIPKRKDTNLIFIEPH